MALSWDNFEVKETGCPVLDGAAMYGPPSRPSKYPWDSAGVIGICYAGKMSGGLPTVDVAYEMAIYARYYEWRENDWHELGGPDAFLGWLVERTSSATHEDWGISWPDEYENAYQFGNPEQYQVEPYRELMRRHFDQAAYVADRDFMIEKTYRRPLKDSYK